MKKITSMKAAGQLVLVELLNAEEAMGSGRIKLSDNTKLEAPQAYLIDIGPKLDRTEWGIEVGDRVIFSGMMTPLPKLGDSDRQRGIIDAYAIKAVLKEESSLLT